ncbi:E3 ubiquitin-protein ligase RNF113A [Daphnia magna]|uniref:E3 ubiquitin-protein ligase RNF113A n=1 Tax=Daphnia magna TaxID=35525 RepID=UPI001E1BBAEF|nr:E3 ubiquitin-protein ligase RNF113A [Daphnia magna]
MADEESKSSICTFTFKKRRATAMRRKATTEDDKKSSSEDETVVARAGKKESAGLLSAKTSKSTKKSRQEIQNSSDVEIKEKVTVSFQSERTVENKKDDLATSTVQIDTAIDQDARTIFEKSLQVQQELKGKADDKKYRGLANYAQYYEKRDTAQGNAASANVRKGPMRAPANIRSTVRWDYQPDLCKDYKETGFCGFGDSCKFLHDRSDYKFGWQLEREERGKGEPVEDDAKYEIHSDEEELPFKCFICRDSFQHPVVSKCKHYFCEACALKHYRKSQRCFVCGKQTFGVFNPAKVLIERLKLEEEGKTYKEADSDEELNNLEILMQPSGSVVAKKSAGTAAEVEEPVTEIEHIHYADDGVAANDTDSDDDSD